MVVVIFVICYRIGNWGFKWEGKWDSVNIYFHVMLSYSGENVEPRTWVFLSLVLVN